MGTIGKARAAIRREQAVAWGISLLVHAALLLLLAAAGVFRLGAADEQAQEPVDIVMADPSTPGGTGTTHPAGGGQTSSISRPQSSVPCRKLGRTIPETHPAGKRIARRIRPRQMLQQRNHVRQLRLPVPRARRKPLAHRAAPSARLAVRAAQEARAVRAARVALAEPAAAASATAALVTALARTTLAENPRQPSVPTAPSRSTRQASSMRRRRAPSRCCSRSAGTTP